MCRSNKHDRLLLRLNDVSQQMEQQSSSIVRSAQKERQLTTNNRTKCAEITEANRKTKIRFF